MRTIVARNRTMMTAADTLDRVRPFAYALVQRDERASGSRMAAYDSVARRVGVSPAWLRKLIGRRPVAVAAHEYHNICIAYRGLCERIEADAAIDRALAAAIRREADEAIASTSGEMAGVAGFEVG
jgi:hypothetical protein